MEKDIIRTAMVGANTGEKAHKKAQPAPAGNAFVKEQCLPMTVWSDA